MSARERILERVREARARRGGADHPGAFGEWRPEARVSSPVEAFMATFEALGGAALRVPSLEAGGDALQARLDASDRVVLGADVPAVVRAAITAHARPSDDPAVADAAVSWAEGGVSRTGTLLLFSGDGRRVQLLPPRHVILVRSATIHETLTDALAALRPRLPAAVGLHSGPSRSADIGQVMVRGVHGPGEVLCVLVGESLAGG